MADFIGQDDMCNNLKVFIKAARQRGEAMDHVLLAGPPGLGKTTMARIIAYELGVNFRSTTGPVLDRVGDLAAILTAVDDNEVMFIDEIHRINRTVEEFLYSAMEDFHLDIIIGEGAGARSVQIDLKPFTLIGATTRTGLLTTPLRDRFGIPLRLDYYSEKDLAKIIIRAAKIMKICITDAAVNTVAKCSRATPRIAERLLRRLRDFAVVKNSNIIDHELALGALKDMGVGKFGLDIMDRRYLQIIAKNFQGGPVGIDTIAITINESRDMVEDVIEPYLIKIGFLNRSPRGRILTKQAMEHIDIKQDLKAQNLDTLSI